MLDADSDPDLVQLRPGERDMTLRYRDLPPGEDPGRLVSSGAIETPCIHATALDRLPGFNDLFLRGAVQLFTAHPARCFRPSAYRRE